MPTETVPTLTLTPADVAHLADALRPYHAIYGSFFSRSEAREWAERYRHGLLSPLERTSIEPIVIAQVGASDTAIHCLQQCLTDSTWDDDAILRRHWQEVAVDLDHAEGILIADGSDCPNKGQHSVGVKRQYCGEVGTIANGQAGVFLAYAGPHGATLLDRRLYLPQEWLSDPACAERRARCRIPEAVTFQTKNELTLAMVQEVVASRALRCRWFLADEAFGRDTTLLDALESLGLWYMVEVPLETTLWLDPAASATTAQALFRTLASHSWSRRLVGAGTKGPRIAEAHVRRVRAQRDGRPGPAVWLILRLDPESGAQKAFLSNAPATLSAARLVMVRGMRWSVEQIFEVGKQQLGMGDDDVRSWSGWHHHMTLVTLAHCCFRVRLQIQLKKSSTADTPTDVSAAQGPVAAPRAHPGGGAGADRLLSPTAHGSGNEPPPTHRRLDR